MDGARITDRFAHRGIRNGGRWSIRRHAHLVLFAFLRYQPGQPSQACAHWCQACPDPQEEKVRIGSSGRQHQDRR